MLMAAAPNPPPPGPPQCTPRASKVPFTPGKLVPWGQGGSCLAAKGCEPEEQVHGEV